jgi:hypothetical protein
MPIGEQTVGEQGAPPTPDTEAAETPEVEAATEAAPLEIAPEEQIAETPATTEASVEEQVSAVLETAGLDLSTFQNEYNQDGALSEESLTALEAGGFPRGLVNQFVAGQVASNAAAVAMVERAAYGTAGSQEDYATMTQWAGSNLPETSIQAFNTAVQSNDEGQITLAVQGLKAQYTASVGNEGVQVQGSASPVTQSADIFETKTSMLEVLASNDYRTSPAFRASVDAKVARSMSAHGGTIPR